MTDVKVISDPDKPPVVAGRRDSGVFIQPAGKSFVLLLSDTELARLVDFAAAGPPQPVATTELLREHA